MNYLIRNINVPVQDITEDNELFLLRGSVARRLNLPPSDIRNIEIIKESVDSRHKKEISCVYTLLFSLDGKVRERPDILPWQPEKPDIKPAGSPATNPVIAGAGPCGLFSAWEFVDKGFSPIIVERGEPVDERSKSVDRFWREGVLNPESNVQFGEGGAGTFSDGKLTTRTHDPRCGKVLEILNLCGAPDDILYKAKAHIGTDILKNVIKNMRERLISRGARFLFSTGMESLVIDDGRIKGASLSDGTVIDTEAVVLAIGHSARDTLETLLNQGVEMAQKSFSAGVRIEHLQEMINRAQYGDIKHFKLTAADYQLSEHLGERTAYTFCMCPGGVVVAAASEPDTIVTNGMSYHKRDGRNANAAYVVSVNPGDFEGRHPLAGIEFQRKLEKKCFLLSGRYAAPVQRLDDFLNHRPTKKAGRIKPSYTGDTVFTDLHGLLPGFISAGIEQSVNAFDRKLRGFYDPDAILTAVETRTSSPVRIIRNENLQSTTVKGLFPAGEGAGYAGGIISAAVDGIRVAERVMAEYSK